MGMEEILVGSYDDKNVTPDRDTIKEVMRSRELGEHIIVGISDDVTLDIITPKLSWIECRLLFSASREGLAAIESRLVYNTRLRYHSTESLAIITQSTPRSRSSSNMSSLRRRESAPQYIKTLFAYSLRNKSSYELPPIPGCYEAIPRHCQAQSVDGKLYVLGGLTAPDDVDGRKEVYVLDLAGQVGWKPCTSMRESRTEFASAVMNGKIYVFGGTDEEDDGHRCEVYDPKADAWNWIKPMPTWRRGHKIAALGNELFLFYTGVLYGSAEVYNTVNDEWRVIHYYQSPSGIAIAVHGRFLCVRRGDIYGADIDGGPYTQLQKNSYRTYWERDDYLCSRPNDGHGLVVGDELLVLQGCDGKVPDRLLQSNGFGQAKTDLVWSVTMKVQDNCRLLCSIEL